MKRWFGFLVIFLVAVSAWAQERAASVLSEELEALQERLDTSPSWLLLERGKILREEGKLADSFSYLLAAQEKSPQNPEIDVELAKAYLLTGDMPLTLYHLNLAIEKRAGFPSPNQIYEVYYFLADLVWLEERFADYEQLLQRVLADDEHFNSDADFDSNLRRNYRDSILNRGLDRSLVLYRIPDSFSLAAHRRLGIFYVQTGRYSEAVDHLIFAVLKSFSRVIDEYRSRTLDFQFSTIADLFDRISGSPGLLRYFDSVEIYATLYYLAEGIYGLDSTKLPAARAIWAFLSTSAAAGSYAEVSSQQLRNPQTYLLSSDSY